ncbi:MAG: hypothetical protein KDD83_13325 [Caldilineaceae bacterium]|nr:hypothetical protein [Caldilineaceae bacterium]
MNHHFIATLGTEPQIVAIAYQLLTRAQRTPTAVTVLHTRRPAPWLAAAIERVTDAFAAQPAWPTPRFVVLDVDDVITPAELTCYGDQLFRLLKTCLAPPATVDLLLAGGRKPMAMVGLSIAQMLFGPEDRVWYLYSDEALRTSGRMTLAEGDHAQLVEIPLAQFTAAPPRLTRAFAADNPTAARSVIDAQRQQQLRHFVEHELTPTEREVAALMVSEIMTVAEAARRLHKQPKTVTNQLSEIYSKMEAYFGLQAQVGVKREFLRKELGDYFGSHLP